MIEDFGSMNGTFVNGQRVKMVTLKPGDSRRPSASTPILVADSGAGKTASRVEMASAKAAAPKINETVMLDTKERRDFLQPSRGAWASSAQIAPARLKVPTLVVRRGKTDRREYTLPTTN